MSLLTHACDISNPTMHYEDFREWGIRITQEFDDIFTAETDLHNTKGTAPPLPFMKWVNYNGFCSSQVGFASK